MKGVWCGGRRRIDVVLIPNYGEIIQCRCNTVYRPAGGAPSCESPDRAKKHRGFRVSA